MLQLTYQTPKGGTSAIFEYETKFANKIKLAENLPAYQKIEKHAQDCIYAHTGFGWHAIVATDFIDKVIAMTDDEFIKWATQVK